MATKKATSKVKKSVTASKPAAKKAPAKKTPAKKAPAKKAVAKKKPAVKIIPPRAEPPLHSEVAKLAHHYWEQRGHEHGAHDDDWLRAEKDLS
jgi:hypothetical protein